MTASLSDLQISSASLQYVRVSITEASGADPTADTVAMAFPVLEGEPTTFYGGNWVTLAGIHYAQCLVGPGGTVTLAPGFYNVFVKVSDNPEIPVLFSGLLEVT